MNTIPIIDCHQHLWDLTKVRPPWLPKDGPLAKSHTLADYHREAEGLNISKTIYMEVDVAPNQRDAEADYVLDLCQRADSKMVGAVIRGDPSADDFAKTILRYKDNKHMKGVRQVLHGGSTPRYYCLQQKFVEGCRMLGKFGLRFDICIRAGELLDAAILVDKCPDTQFVLDHCGNANPQAKDLSAWKRDIGMVAKKKNVVCKISGIIASAKHDPADPSASLRASLEPIIVHCAEVFGKDRIIWASDWPVCTRVASLRQWVETARGIVHRWTDEDQHKLFHVNAEKFYGV